jgi:hypothetical protein
MPVRKKILALVILVIFVITFAACSSSKDVCPAYSQSSSELPDSNRG